MKAVSPGPVTFDAVGGGSTATSGTTSWTHTIANPQEDDIVAIVIIKVAKASGGSFASYTRTVTYGGFPMTSFVAFDDNNVTNGFIEIFTLKNPPSGAQTVSVSVNNSPTRLIGQSMTYYNVGYIDPYYTAGFYGASGTTTPYTSDVHANGAAVYCVSAIGTITASSGGTQRFLSSNAAGSLLIRDSVNAGAAVAFGATRSSGAAYIYYSIIMHANGGIRAFSETYKGTSVYSTSVTPAGTMSWDTLDIQYGGSGVIGIVALDVGMTNNTGTISGVGATWGGQAMTEITNSGVIYRDATYGGGYLGLYYLMNPPAGIHTITVSWGGTAVKHGVIAGAILYAGASPLIGAATTYNSASGTGPSYSVPSTAQSYAVGIMQVGNNFTADVSGNAFGGADIATTTQHANYVRFYMRTGFPTSTTFAMTQSASARAVGLGIAFTDDLSEENTNRSSAAIPSGVTGAYVTLIGGGGGGASGATRNNSTRPSGYGGGGGGGGGAVRRAFVPLGLLGSTYSVTVGTGGAATTAQGQDGNDGNASVFTSGSITISAGGGLKGVQGLTPSGGAGGTVSGLSGITYENVENGAAGGDGSTATTGTVGGSSTYAGAGGGGGGANITSAYGGGVGGSSLAVVGTSGTPTAAPSGFGGAGGGGASGGSGSGSGGNGSTGGVYGGGGGGGGGKEGSFLGSGGKGGAGGIGYTLIEWVV